VPPLFKTLKSPLGTVYVTPAAAAKVVLIWVIEPTSLTVSVRCR